MQRFTQRPSLVPVSLKIKLLFAMQIARVIDTHACMAGPESLATLLR
jgi:hypothetical protein